MWWILAFQVINTSTFATVSLEGHTAPVLSVDMDNAGKTVVSSSCDGSIRIWSVDTKKQVAERRYSLNYERRVLKMLVQQYCKCYIDRCRLLRAAIPSLMTCL